jgi:4a-hydroxytetrahydrobiopterin dehydratase
MNTNDLASKRCVPCEGGVAPYTLEQANRLMQQLNVEWTLVEGGQALRRAFAFRDFYRTMSFVNGLAHLANLEDHHPDLEVGYNYCRIRVSTHAVGGLSENDFILAAKIDRLAAG